MNEKIVPLLKQGKFSLGLKIAVKEYSNLGQSNPTLTFKKIIDQLYPYLKIFFLAMLSPVGFVFLFLFLLFKMLKDPKGGILSSRRTNLPTTHKKKSSFFSDSSGCGGDSDGDTGSF